MKTIKTTFAILFITLLSISCSKDDDNPSAPAPATTNSDIIGTWQYRSVSGTITSPAGTSPMVCNNTTGTITLNSNLTYTMSNVDSACNYSVSGINLSLPLSIVANNGTYVRNNNSLVTTPSSGTVFNMTIQELTSNRMKLNLIRTIGASNTNVVYVLEK